MNGIFTEEINKIARQAVMKDKIAEMRARGVKFSDSLEKAVIELTESVTKKLEQRLPSIKVESLEDVIKKLIPEAEYCVKLVFIELSSEYRSNGDWEAYAALHWLKGAAGLQL